MPESEIGTVAEHLARVRDNILQLEKKHGRAPGSVSLLAVSKTKPADRVREAAMAGQTAFGENYVEEGVSKRETLNSLELTWHYIGHIQSNKTRLIATHYDWVQSIDRLKIAKRLDEQRSTDLPPLNICVQLKLDDEESKSGCTTAELDTLAAYIDSAPNLTLRGLMAIPAPRTDMEDQRRVFAELRGWYDKLRGEYPTVDTLSMGMSGDMEAAIAEGATMVRIGTAVFGSREKR